MGPYKNKVLVIANRTADSTALREAMQARCGRGPAAFTLLVPRSGHDLASAQSFVMSSLDRLREAGLEVDGGLGDADPIVALHETWDPGRFDEVIVSTLPTDVSRWLQFDLPHRVARITGARVTHVVAPLEPQAAARAASGVMSG
jgi:hypothetical protein